ncbi:MAG TPA: methylated-DNA--[protein]-cysteine S-methyltransferase [Acidimicrobiales bacterium]|nr:methylated-DNA--[protein]-cysteine S-methyltransferase [Acidimicrobiales bacterium]
MTTVGVRAERDTWWALETPVGTMVLVGNEAALHQVLLPGAAAEARPRLDRALESRPPVLAEAEDQLRQYFAGERRAFDLPLDPAGTAFQRAAWFALEEIPFATTSTYAAQAARLGRPSAVRAVGAANSRNPLPIVLACHRVIGSNGRLVGYAGGLGLKQWLLDHERRVDGEVQ